MMKYFFLTTILFLGTVFLLPFSVQALTISPVKIEISGDPGQTLTGELELYNEQADTETFYSSTDNFESRGESGAPFFLSQKTGLASWIKTDDKVVLKPKDVKKIPYSIVVPKNAEPGGYFAAILWGMTPPDAIKGGQVAVGGRLGVLILLKVSGEVKEAGGLLDFSTGNKLSSTLPINFSFRFNNNGGNRIVPNGEITIKNLFGITTVVLPANKNEGSVLPGSSRKFSAVWQSKQQIVDGKSADQNLGFFETAGQEWSELHFGFYTATMKLTYGVTNQIANASYSFFIIPWQLLIIVLVIILVIGFVGRIGLRKYNRWIIAQARQQ